VAKVCFKNLTAVSRNTHRSGVLNAHVLNEDKCDDSKYSFYEELQQLISYFLKCHLKILFGVFTAKLGRQSTAHQ